MLLVEDFEDADACAGTAFKGGGEEVPGFEAGLAIDGGEEAVVLVGIVEDEGFAAGEDGAGDTAAGRNADGITAAHGDMADEVAGVLFEEEEAGAFGADEAGGFSGNEVEEGAEIAFGAHADADFDQSGQDLARREPVLSVFSHCRCPHSLPLLAAAPKYLTIFADVHEVFTDLGEAGGVGG